MALDEALAGRVRSALGSRSGIEEKAAFGGMMFKINGNMICQITSNGRLDFRTGADRNSEALAMPNVEEKKLGAKVLNSMAVHTNPAGASDEELSAIVNMAFEVTEALPPKVK